MDEEKRCACLSFDRYECWAARYDYFALGDGNSETEAHGGPCECSCHDEYEDDEED